MTDACDEIDAVAAAYAEAVWEKQPERLAALYDECARVFDAWEPWSYEDLAARRGALESWLGSLGDEKVRAVFDEVRCSVSGDMGLFTAIGTYAAIDPAGETLRSMQNRLTWVLARRGDGWSIVHEHTSAPIGEGLKAVLHRG